MANWKQILEAVVGKGKMSKNERNMKAFEQKKARGPIRPVFHITRNENVDNILKEGLKSNPEGMTNVNSANNPFKNLGVEGGGVWVTDSPNIFPVYGTQLGKKDRASNLSTLRIDLPKSSLPDITAVYNPYGADSKLITADDPNLFAPFNAWNGMPAPTTALLTDIPPERITNLGYVEHMPNTRVKDRSDVVDAEKGAGDGFIYGLARGDLMDLTGTTGHRVPNMRPRYEKSPQRYVIDYLKHNQPIYNRTGNFPRENSNLTRQAITNVQERTRDKRWFSNRDKRYSTDFIPIKKWEDEYTPYVPYGHSVDEYKNRKFAPGAISRGIGGEGLPDIKQRNFNWKKYKELTEMGKSPFDASVQSAPQMALDWDDIVINGYNATPKVHPVGKYVFEPGHVSQGGINPFRRAIVPYVPGGNNIGPIDNTASLPELADFLKQHSDEVAEWIKPQSGKLMPEWLIPTTQNTTLEPPISRIKDPNNPKWQEVLRALMYYRSLPYWVK